MKRVHTHPLAKRKGRNQGSSFLAIMMMMAAIALAGATYLHSATESVRASRRQAINIQLTNLCEAGIQTGLRTFWREFKQSQNFVSMDSVLGGASLASPKGSQSGQIAGIGRFSVGVIDFETPNGDTYTRNVILRGVGWIDSNGNNALDNNEPMKIVDVSSTFRLARSEVFDYTYFVNNYGWMDGFNESNLIVNGDMRANGNFAFLNGLPTINGSVYAASNEKLSPVAAGILTGIPVKQTNSAYRTSQNANTNAAENENRWRPSYDPAVHGDRTSATYAAWRDILFDSDGFISGEQVNGAVMADANGFRSWQRTSAGATPTISTLDRAPTQEVIMPDLSNIAEYQALSNSYINDKATFVDGTANPNFGVGAYCEVWNSTLNRYVRIDTNGVVNGSAILVGTSTRPIRIHGPVTVTQDVLIKGNVSGQGTLYAGRNVHIVGSIRYNNKPNFRGTSPAAIDAQNEKADMLGLAARGSVIMGKTTSFTATYPLQYMTPPFTKGRYDENGNWIPPYNALEVDATGTQRYKTVLGDSTMNSLAESINQIDAVLYTNFVGGGNIGNGGGGVLFNGSIISRDEAMVVYSLPMRMNYDTRIKERSLSSKPLIDIKLPRSPVMLRSSWQDRGFYVYL